MPKTGWKYTKQAPNKSTTNMLKRSNASSRPNRRAPKKNDLNMRSNETIKRLQMYNNGKAIRNKEGKIVGGQYMMRDRAGDTKITSATGRIAPDRRWFGNTRVVGATELDQFREAMTTSVADPYSVVLRRKKLPMGLLQDVAEYAKHGKASGLLENEPFEQTFGTKNRRKRVKLDQYVEVRNANMTRKRNKSSVPGGGAAEVVKKTIHTSNTDTNDDSNNNNNDDASAYSALLSAAQQSNQVYQEVNTREGIVPWGRDSNIDRKEGEGVDWRHEKKDDLFLKGQSKRIWGEFFKVIDCSDVILHIIDCRNVPGTRCRMIEDHLSKHAKHKHLVFILNKIDLVPNWVAKRWMGELARDRPTIAFHASMTHAFGKGALISLLRQFGKLHEDKKQISVGVVGYPNVGKSSVINTLISKKSCKVAPIPGETKIWQYITLFKRISLIDCPGVVVDTAGDTEEDSVLKGVVRAERLENPEDFAPAVCRQVQPEHIRAQYKLDKTVVWTPEQPLPLMEAIAQQSGRLLKGGEPCIRSAAIMLINDFQRGRLPHYVAPPELKDNEQDEEKGGATKERTNEIEGIQTIEQDLSGVGQGNMQKPGYLEENNDDNQDDPIAGKEDDKKEGVKLTGEDKEENADDGADDDDDDDSEDEVQVEADGAWDDE